MQVTFIAKEVRRRLDLNIWDEDREIMVQLPFVENPVTRNATFTTADKRIIKLLLAYHLVRSGQVIMDTPEEVVAAYLTDDSRKDRFTEADISKISDKAAELLGAHYRITATVPDIIRFSLVGKIVTKIAEEIIKKNPVATDKKLSGDEVLQALIKAGIVRQEKKAYIEVSTGEPIGTHAAAVEWALLNADILEQPQVVV